MTTSEIVLDIKAALETFDYRRADELADSLARAVLASDKPQPAEVPKVLALLRQKACFTAMTHVADALIQAGQGDPTVRRQYAQALIERRMLVPAEQLLLDALEKYPSPKEEPEFCGLLGRVYKQRYVNAPDAAAEWRRKTLQQSIDWYLGPYKKNRVKHYWHGINVVALLERGSRDGISVSVGEPAENIANQVLAAIESDDTPAEQVYAFRFATEVEALVALRRYEQALDRLREYVLHPGADAFELGSTLRQLIEVWGLSDKTSPGGSLLPVLRSRLLRAKGGALTLEAVNIPAEMSRLANLEKVHGFDGFQSLQWYRDGLDRCSAIARIERAGQGVGTGWLVRASDLFETASSEPLLVTNAHVVSASSPPYPKALRPIDAVANFQVAGVKSKVKPEAVWSSAVEHLDCTVVRLENPPAVAPLPIGPEPFWEEVPSPRMYIIGHPGGRDLEFSLQDNQLVSCDPGRCKIRYRTPTEGGSSGSPVFDATWQVIGLHHAGDDEARSGDANEGISWISIQGAAHRHAFV